MIIAIAGRKHSGKDTAAKCIRELISQHSKKRCGSIALADPIKRILSYMAGDDLKDWYDNDKKKEVVTRFGMTRREMLTKFGTDFVHPINNQLWCLMAEDEITKTGITLPIISDIRMPHELDWVNNRKGGSIIVKLIGDPMNLNDGVGNDHPSEKLVDELCADFVINTNTLEVNDLKYKLKEILISKNVI